jgi:hypothetical protein
VAQAVEHLLCKHEALRSNLGKGREGQDRIGQHRKGKKGKRKERE